MTYRMACIAAAMSAALLTQGTADAAEPANGVKSYRWVDSNGVTHIGDSVPPEHAPQGRSELNPQGVPVKVIPKQLSPTEAAAAQQAAAEKDRIRQRDALLLSTYTQVRDIELQRDERLSLIDGQMEIARVSIHSADQRLASLQGRMRNFQPYSTAANARRMPDQLAEEVVQTLKERRNLQQTLVSRESEKRETRTQFDADIARYRELTSRATATR